MRTDNDNNISVSSTQVGIVYVVGVIISKAFACLLVYRISRDTEVHSGTIATVSSVISCSILNMNQVL